MAQRGTGRSARTCRSRFAPAPERGAQPTVLSRRDSVVFPRPPPQETVSTRKGTARNAPSQARVYLPRLPLRRGPGRRPRCLPCGRRLRLASRMRRRSALRSLRWRDVTLPCLGGETLCGSGAGSALRRRKGLRRRWPTALRGETLCGSGAGSALRRRKGLRRRWPTLLSFDHTRRNAPIFRLLSDPLQGPSIGCDSTDAGAYCASRRSVICGAPPEPGPDVRRGTARPARPSGRKRARD